ncbi:R3H domain-containing nucleic acid-binding protein [Coleofasciculus sp. FACHB-1120]|uniref:Jag family protein n=1 Tax=Coleofasciculus sp. FACHB-1120 TaxID=2692783 RepID=UPI001685CF99|nr:R3H domain-containing nucleic acid-binding protein [Coleofasciculus sp. FACHB-1120]MBD2741709.1 RNA-binding protein [Coleofasciculus sp. FACHB-1120]
MSDRRMQRGQQWLEQLLQLAQFPTGVKETAIQTIPQGSDSSQAELEAYWLTIDETKLTSAQIQALVGSEGATLDAIQYLANAILNLGQEREEQTAYTIELDGYRARRQAELQALAEDAAQQVRSSGQEFELKSLSSAERRQVHTFFQECDDLETYSRGQEPDRRLVVRLKS